MIHVSARSLKLEVQRSSLFERSALKYLVLDSINSQPGHGYEVIQELAETSGGAYIPRPGTVYRILYKLEGTGYIELSRDHHKIVYRTTDKGWLFLRNHRAKVSKYRERIAAEPAPAISPNHVALMKDIKNLFNVVAYLASQRSGDASMIAAVRAVIENARKEIEALTKSKRNNGP